MPVEKTYLVNFATLVNNRSEILPALFKRAQKLSNVQQKIRSELDPPLSEHLIVADFNNQSLILHTDSPAWAARLRYNISKILDIARISCGLSELRSVRIKVVLSENGITGVKRKIELSNQSKQLILNAAESTSDPQLRSVLLRISKN